MVIGIRIWCAVTKVIKICNTRVEKEDTSNNHWEGYQGHIGAIALPLLNLGQNPE